MKIPEVFEDLTTEWLTEALGHTVIQANVISDDAKEEVEEIYGVFGQLFRLSLTYETAEVDVPPS